MPRKFCVVVVAVVLLVMPAMTAIRAQAQAVTLIAVGTATGVGPGETVEVYWLPGPGQAIPMLPAIEPGSRATFAIVVSNISASANTAACTQAFSVPVMANTGLNTLQVSLAGGAELTVNGQVAGILDPCFAAGGKRNTIAVGRQIPPELQERFTAAPNELPASTSDGLNLNRIWGWTSSIVDADGRTLASVSPPGSDVGGAPYVLRISGVLN